MKFHNKILYYSLCVQCATWIMIDCLSTGHLMNNKRALSPSLSWTGISKAIKNLRSKSWANKQRSLGRGCCFAVNWFKYLWATFNIYPTTHNNLKWCWVSVNNKEKINYKMMILSDDYESSFHLSPSLSLSLSNLYVN